jgi:FAD-dependent urate hydroxylase
MAHEQLDTCIVGAGPYGLSVAAHLRDQQIPVRIFGDPLSAWRKNMPRQMFLKSVASASSLSTPKPGHKLADFCLQSGIKPLTDEEPIPIDLFVRYGLWFQENLVPDVEQEHVVEVAPNSAGFVVRTDSGEELHARNVVVATGHLKYAYVPDELRAIAPNGPAADAPVSHSSQHEDFSRFEDLDVAVLGAGQSALETAALLAEAGAHPHILARTDRLLWASPPNGSANGSQFRLHKPDSPLGRGISLYAVSRAPTAVSRLPLRSRLLLVRRILGPSGAWWLRERVLGVVDVRQRWRLEKASCIDGRIRLQGAMEDGADELVVDHVIAGTGYRVDVDALDLLSEELRGRIRRNYGWPALTRGSESSVPGLFFTGLPAAATFGPLLRFVAGTSFSAPRVAGSIAATRR